MFKKYQVIKRNGEVSLVALSEMYEGRLYIFGGPEYFYDTDAPLEVLHTYYTRKFKSEDPEDEIEIDYWKKWNPPVEKLSDTGWLSPEGRMYKCDYNEHETLARQLCAYFYDTLKHSELLEQKGWLRLQNGLVIGKNTTLDQLATLIEINDKYNHSHLHAEIKHRAKSWKNNYAMARS